MFDGCGVPPSETYEQGGLQEVQLEDGSTAYIQHTVHMPQPSTILAIQADGTIADLQTEGGAMDAETISVLEQYTTKVSPVWLAEQEADHSPAATHTAFSVSFFLGSRAFGLWNVRRLSTNMAKFLNDLL